MESSSPNPYAPPGGYRMLRATTSLHYNPRPPTHAEQTEIDYLLYYEQLQQQAQANRRQAATGRR